MTTKVQEILSANWALSPIFHVVRIFGLAPYAVEVKHSRARWRVSKVSLVYSVFFFMVLFLCLMPLVNHIRHTIHQGKQDKIAMYTELFRRVSGIIICIINMILSISNRYKSCYLMEDLNRLDLDLICHGIKLDFKNMRKENTILVMVLGLFLLASVAIHSAVVDLEDESAIYRSTSILLFIVYSSTITQFIGFVLALQKRFQILNKYVRSMNHHKQVHENFFAKQNPLQRGMYHPNKDINTKKDLTTPNRLHIDTHPRTIWSKLSTNIIYVTSAKKKANALSFVCDFHDRLCEWGSSLNSLFSIQILLTMGMAAIVVVVTLYVFYLMLSKNEKYTMSFESTVILLNWGLWFFSMIFGMSYVCSKTKDEANKMSTLLYCANFDYSDEDGRTYTEMFSLQMLHQKVEFSACGFFTVDLWSLRTTLTFITTYLVFFIQFEMAARSKRINNVDFCQP